MLILTSGIQSIRPTQQKGVTANQSMRKRVGCGWRGRLVRALAGVWAEAAAGSIFSHTHRVQTHTHTQTDLRYPTISLNIGCKSLFH